MNSDNLYNKLHKSSSELDEDFLTEALTHLLRYLQEYEPQACNSILNRFTDNIINQVDADISEIEISTQFDTKTSGIPDIRLRHPEFLVLIEVKVDADFHDGQLEGYRLFLERSNTPNVRLITLTRYGQSSDKPEVDLAIRWNQVADWLEKSTLHNQQADYLRNEFVGFLKQRGVAMDKVEWSLVSGVTSLQYLLGMTSEALTKENISYKGTAGSTDGCWQGFNKKCESGAMIFIGVYFNDPATLCVETGYGVIHGNIDPSVGTLKDGKLCITLNLASEEVYFFARSKQSQLACLEKFVGDSVRYADKLITEHS